MTTATQPVGTNGGAKAPAVRSENEVSYVPFLEKEEIRLTVGMVRRLFTVPTKSGKPCPDEQIIRFIMMCKARQLNPFVGDAYLVGYDSNDGPVFNLITAHQALLKRAEVHPQYDGMESGVMTLDKDGNLTEREGDFTFDGEKLVGGWARVHCKGRRIPTFRRAKLATYNAGRSRWRTDPAGMIVKVAEADALRSTFPSTLGGMHLEQEYDRQAVPTPSLAPPDSGRHSLRAPHPEETPQEHPADAPDPEPGEVAPSQEEMAAIDLAVDYEEQIGAAEDEEALRKTEAAIDQDAATLGQERVGILGEALARKRGTLKTVKKGR